jgi:hypothetical protein
MVLNADVLIQYMLVLRSPGLDEKGFRKGLIEGVVGGEVFVLLSI